MATGLPACCGRRAIASIVLALLPGLAGAAPPNMSVADYLVRKRQIDVSSRTAQSACNVNVSEPREVCLSMAIGNAGVAKADLEVAYRSTPRTRFEASEARAQARFLLARERCTEAAQALRGECTRDARTARLQAQADAAAAMHAAEANDAAAEACAAAAPKSAQARAPACTPVRPARNLSAR